MDMAVGSGFGFRAPSLHNISDRRVARSRATPCRVCPRRLDRMIDREKVLTVLRRRFTGASDRDLAAAANAIVGLADEWDDVTEREPDLLAHLTQPCGPGCCIIGESREVSDYRLLVRRG